MALLTPASVAECLGVILDATLSVKAQVTGVARSALLQFDMWFGMAESQFVIVVKYGRL